MSTETSLKKFGLLTATLTVFAGICSSAMGHLPGTVIQITDNSYGDYSPQISGGNIAWRSDAEIFVFLSPCSERLIADLNHDCQVNLADLSIMALQWRACTLVPQTDCSD